MLQQVCIMGMFQQVHISCQHSGASMFTKQILNFCHKRWQQTDQIPGLWETSRIKLDITGYKLLYLGNTRYNYIYPDITGYSYKPIITSTDHALMSQEKTTRNLEETKSSYRAKYDGEFLMLQNADLKRRECSVNIIVLQKPYLQFKYYSFYIFETHF